jgi:hypothetical protein
MSTSELSRSFDNGRPNPTLEPEWDVLHEIKWTLSQQLTGGTIIHTKGHQDDRENTRISLSWLSSTLTLTD